MIIVPDILSRFLLDCGCNLGRLSFLDFFIWFMVTSLLETYVVIRLPVRFLQTLLAIF